MSEEEADPQVFLDAPNLVPFPGEAEVSVEASSSPSLTLPSDLHGSEARIAEATHSSPSNT